MILFFLYVYIYISISPSSALVLDVNTNKKCLSNHKNVFPDPSSDVQIIFMQQKWLRNTCKQLSIHWHESVEKHPFCMYNHVDGWSQYKCRTSEAKKKKKTPCWHSWTLSFWEVVIECVSQRNLVQTQVWAFTSGWYTDKQRDDKLHIDISQFNEATTATANTESI